MASDNSGKCFKCSKLIYNKQNHVTCHDCKHHFHMREKCSGFKINKYKSLVLENPNYKFQCIYCQMYKCNHCLNPVFDHQNALECDNRLCKGWVHLRCTNISHDDYISILNGEREITWFCKSCVDFPFCSISNINLNKFFTDKDIIERKILTILTEGTTQIFKDCSVCKRKIVNKLYKAMYCNSCYHPVHRKCSGISLNDLNTINKIKDLEYWECSECNNHKFPFSQATQAEVLQQNFNSNFQCKCKSSQKIERGNVFKMSKFNKMSDIKYGPDKDNFMDKNYDLEPNFNYYTVHEFHKLKEKLPKDKHNLSIFHTNICSLKQNFEGLEDLLTELGYLFDVIAVSETWNPANKSNKFRPGMLEGYYEYLGTTGYTLKSGCGFYIRGHSNNT